MTKKEFAQKLYSIIRESGIRQTILADALNVTSAAISQFTHGIVLPKPDQLSAILTVLDVSSRERAVMLQHLLILRAIEANGGKPVDMDSIPRIVDEKWMKESEDGFPSTTQKKDDDNVFNLDKLYIGPPGDHLDYIFFHEPTQGVPVLELVDMLAFKPSMKLVDYAGVKCKDLLLRSHGSVICPVALNVTGEQIGMHYCGMMQLVVSDNLPHTTSMLALTLREDDTFRLILAEKTAKLNGLDRLLREEEGEAPAVKWALPVLELTFMPLVIDILERGQRFV